MENHIWTARVLVACGFSVDHTWLLRELNNPSLVKVASSVNKTVSRKRGSLVRISKYQRAKANRGAKSSSFINRTRGYEGVHVINMQYPPGARMGNPDMTGNGTGIVLYFIQNTLFVF